jgi:cell pole-organizing protein PopZ
MGDLRNEPSMEDILASIKRIIAEDGAAALSTPRSKPAPRDEVPLAPLEPPTPLEPPAPLEVAPEPELHAEASLPEQAPPAESAAFPQEAQDDPVPPPPPAPSTLVSPNAAQASRQSLAALSAMVIRPEVAAETSPGNTLEALVRELLRPMLKDWLDAKLPELVEALVSKEIARITGKSL